MQFQFSIALKPASTGLKALKSKLEKALVTGLLGYEPEKMVACTLVFEGTAEEVARQKNLVIRLAKRHGGMAAGGENGSRGYQLTFGIAYIRDWVMDHWVLAESFETSVPWTRLEGMVEAVKKRLYAECEARKLPGKPFVTARVTQIYETGAAVYFYFAYYYKGVEDPTRVYHELENAAREEILAHGGSLSHHHGVGKIRQGFLPAIASPATLAWQAAAKQALDPENVFACGNQTPPAAGAPAHAGAAAPSAPGGH
jgi:alkyldihydroxyacetonephosphate synthase